LAEQTIDLKSTWAILRRRAGLLVLAGVLGAAAGGAAAFYRPPVYSSSSTILLPPVPQGASSATPIHTIDTQVEIAKSEAVLGPAGQAVSPRLTVAQVLDRVTIEAPTSDVIVVRASGATPGEAQGLAAAVATAETAYLERAQDTVDDDRQQALSARAQTLKDSLAAVTTEITNTQARLRGESRSSVAGKADAAALASLTAQQADLVLQLDKVEGQMSAGSETSGTASSPARIIQPASPAQRRSVVLGYALFAGSGAAAALFLAGLVTVLRERRESTMRSRDQVADAIGTPVVASIQSRAPRSVAGWTSLLQAYSPHEVERWTLRQLIRLVTPGHPGSLAAEPEETDSPPSMVLVTLSGDHRALAVGPQIASFAASTGTETLLVPAQQHESANALWAACSGVAPDQPVRPGLRVDTHRHARRSADLVVMVAVVDRTRPDLRLSGAAQAVTLLAVTAGSATADELARVALAADDMGHPIARVVVVDPDPFDRTTGRLLPTERAQQVPLPSRMTGPAHVGEATPLDAHRRTR
jgi:capsular polysaccharide biosynthesis protein